MLLLAVMWFPLSWQGRDHDDDAQHTAAAGSSESPRWWGSVGVHRASSRDKDTDEGGTTSSQSASMSIHPSIHPSILRRMPISPGTPLPAAATRTGRRGVARHCRRHQSSRSSFYLPPSLSHSLFVPVPVRSRSVPFAPAVRASLGLAAVHKQGRSCSAPWPGPACVLACA